MITTEVSEVATTSEDLSQNIEKKVSLTTAIIAVCLAISSILGGSASDDVIKYTIKANDMWSMYQAKSIKYNLYLLEKERMEFSYTHLAIGPEKDAYKKKIDEFGVKVATYDSEKEPIKRQAEEHSASAEHADSRADIYDIAEGLYQIALILGAIAIIAKNQKMWFLSGALGLLGISGSVYAYLL